MSANAVSSSVVSDLSALSLNAASTLNTNASATTIASGNTGVGIASANSTGKGSTGSSISAANGTSVNTDNARFAGGTAVAADVTPTGGNVASAWSSAANVLGQTISIAGSFAESIATGLGSLLGGASTTPAPTTPAEAPKQ